MKILLLTVILMLTACSNASSEASNEMKREGLIGKVHKVQTLIYNAKFQNNKIVKDGKPDPYREIDFFPLEETCIYNEKGQLDSTIYVLDDIKYISVFSYENGNVSNEKRFQNGKLSIEKKFIYKEGELVNTIEDMYYGDEKSTNEYPVDISKIEYIDGKRIEHGYTEKDFTIKDNLGRILKTSMYNEMDECLDIKEFKYNEKGWLETSTTSYGVKASYEYNKTDETGNWTYMVIMVDGEPYGIAERTITYHK